MARPLVGLEQVGRARRRPAPRGSGRRSPSRRAGAQPSSAQIVGATSTRRADARNEPELAHALAREHERRPGLHEPERAVLAEVAALVLPVVRGGVQHAEVGGGGRVEELGDLVERVRVGVLRPVRERVGALVGERRELRRSTGRRGDRGPSTGDALVGAVGVAAERDPAVVGEGLVGAVAGRAHHVDDRVEGAVEEHLERRLGLVPVGVGDLVGARWGRGLRLGGHGPRGYARDAPGRRRRDLEPVWTRRALGSDSAVHGSTRRSRESAKRLIVRRHRDHVKYVGPKRTGSCGTCYRDLLSRTSAGGSS